MSKLKPEVGTVLVVTDHCPMDAPEFLVLSEMEHCGTSPGVDNGTLYHYQFSVLTRPGEKFAAPGAGRETWFADEMRSLDQYGDKPEGE